MSSGRHRRGLGYLGFLVIAALVASAVALLGRGILVERAGHAAALAWVVGCAVSFAASVASGLLVALGDRLALAGVTVALGSMLLRLAVLVPVAAAVAVTLSVQLRPFLLAVAFSYLALLLVDTVYAVGIARSAGTRASSSAD